MTQHLHSFIFAAMVGTPGLLISVDGYKVEGLVEGLGLPGWMVVDAASAGPATVIDRVNRLRQTRAAVSADLLRASAKARASVVQFARDLATLRPAG